MLTAVGSWTNEGTITGTPPGGTGVTHTSNQVVVNVPAESSFTVEKKQKLAGEFTTAELAGKVGETVHYEIIVTNTGNVPLKISNVVDVNCTGMTGGASEIGVGGSTIFTCEHTLASAGPYVNEATVVGNEKPQTSNKVVVQVAAQQVKAQCAINEAAIVLQRRDRLQARTVHGQHQLAWDQADHVPAGRQEDQDAEVIPGEGRSSSRCGSTPASSTTGHTR